MKYLKLSFLAVLLFLTSVLYAQDLQSFIGKSIQDKEVKESFQEMDLKLTWDVEDIMGKEYTSKRKGIRLWSKNNKVIDIILQGYPYKWQLLVYKLVI